MQKAALHRSLHVHKPVQCCRIIIILCVYGSVSRDVNSIYNTIVARNACTNECMLVFLVPFYVASITQAVERMFMLLCS